MCAELIVKKGQIRATLGLSGRRGANLPERPFQNGQDRRSRSARLEQAPQRIFDRTARHRLSKEKSNYMAINAMAVSIALLVAQACPICGLSIGQGPCPPAWPDFGHLNDCRTDAAIRVLCIDRFLEWFSNGRYAPFLGWLQFDNHFCGRMRSRNRAVEERSRSRCSRWARHGRTDHALSDRSLLI